LASQFQPLDIPPPFARNPPFVSCGVLIHVNAYLGVIPAFGSKDLAKVAARLAADETMHFTVLTSALGRPLPAGALSFGA
jgi:hypothetical protein